MQCSRKHRKFWNEKETRFLRNTLPQIKRSPGQFLKTNVLRWNRYLGSHKLKLTSLFCPLLVSSLPTSMSSFVKPKDSITSRILGKHLQMNDLNKCSLIPHKLMWHFCFLSSRAENRFKPAFEELAKWLSWVRKRFCFCIS